MQVRVMIMYVMLNYNNSVQRMLFNVYVHVNYYYCTLAYPLVFCNKSICVAILYIYRYYNNDIFYYTIIIHFTACNNQQRTLRTH